MFSFFTFFLLEPWIKTSKKGGVLIALSLLGVLEISLFSGSSVVSNSEVEFHC